MSHKVGGGWGYLSSAIKGRPLWASGLKNYGSFGEKVHGRFQGFHRKSTGRKSN